jgi:HEAT repeat protein
MHRYPTQASIRQAPALLILALLAAVGGLRAQPAPDGLEQALEKLNIPAALAAYDGATKSSGPSQELLARIARADLRYCLEEGKGWDRVEAARALATLGDPRGAQGLIEGLDSEFSQVRGRVAEWAGQLGVREALPRLRGMAADAGLPANERLEAGKALGRLGDGAAARALAVELLRHDRQGVRAGAVDLLAQVGEEADLVLLKERLGDPDRRVALKAAEALARLGDPEGTEKLRGWLADTDPRLRARAAWYLRAAGDASGRDVVLRIVDEGLKPDLPEDKNLPFALTALSWIDPEAALPALRRALSMMEWPGGRLLAARRLAELGRPEALPVLRELYGNMENERAMAAVRGQMVRSASQLPDSPELRDFAQRASADAAASVRRQALTLRAALGDASVLADLRQILGGPDLGPRVWAAEAVLGFGGGPAALEEPFEAD